VGRVLKDLMEALKKHLGDIVHGPPARSRGFQITVVKHLEKRVSGKTDQRKSHNGRGVVFEAVIKTVVGHQNIEPLVFDLPPLMSDLTNRLSRHNGPGQSRTPVPVRDLSFGRGLPRADNAKGPSELWPPIKPLLVPALIEDRALVFETRRLAPKKSSGILEEIGVVVLENKDNVFGMVL
jgi:hypothetical protein